jgi:hypothetical protein
VISYIVNGSRSLRTRNVLLAGTLYIIGWIVFIVVFFTELSDGSMRWASKDLKVVTFTMNSVTESVFSTGGFHVTFNCFSFSGSTSTSSGGLGSNSGREGNIVTCS